MYGYFRHGTLPLASVAHTDVHTVTERNRGLLLAVQGKFKHWCMRTAAQYNCIQPERKLADNYKAVGNIYPFIGFFSETY